MKVCVKFLILNLEAFNFQYNISFIDLPLRGFGEILPSLLIFPSGQSPSGISSLRVIFRRIPLTPGLECEMMQDFFEKYLIELNERDGKL
jgi:hypothetical protein